MSDTFMKDKPVLPLLLSMALPMVLSMLVNSLYNIVDSYFVSKISEDAMTALSLVYPIQNLILAVAVGFGVGINAVIAFYLGAGDKDTADKAATQGMTLTVVHSVVFSLCSILIMPTFLRLFTDSETVIALGLRYSNIVFLFGIMQILGIAFEKIYQAVGSMNISMLSLTAGGVANIILDPLLIFGIGPFPEMGIEGAALATGLGQTLSLVIYLVVYRFKTIPVQFRKEYIKPERTMVGKLYAIGIPAALNLALPSLLISALNAILAAYSQVYTLVLGIYYKLQSFLYLPAGGIVQGMRPLIGYNYGAGEHQRVRSIFNIVLVMSGIIMLIGTAICQLVPQPLMELFTQTPEAISAGTQALRIISIGFVLSAVSVTASGALEGLSMGVSSLIISLLRYIVIIIPAAFLLSRVLGAAGVWHAFWITEAVSAVASLIIYRRAIHRPEMG